jgi:hypothetical protein
MTTYYTETKDEIGNTVVLRMQTFNNQIKQVEEITLEQAKTEINKNRYQQFLSKK